MVFIGNDFNAKLGTDEVLFSYHDSTNGILLLDFVNSVEQESVDLPVPKHHKGTT